MQLELTSCHSFPHPLLNLQPGGSGFESHHVHQLFPVVSIDYELSFFLRFVNLGPFGSNNELLQGFHCSALLGRNRVQVNLPRDL